MGREPALDGLRAIAIALVVAFHARVPGFAGGRVGVDVFFVLSGYLITRQLLQGPRLREFYLRRWRRLAPALFAMLAVFVTLSALLPSSDPDWGWDALFAGLYLMDIWAPLTGAHGGLLHTWSLALEVQFYLIWPVVLRLPRPTFWLVTAFIAVTAARFVLLGRAGAIDPLGLSPLRASGLILGGLLAIHLPHIKPRHWMGYAGVALLSVAVAEQGPAGLTLAELSAALLILGASAPGAVRDVLSTSPMVRVGVLSYGLYLWHYPVVWALRPYLDWPGKLLVSAGVGLALAALSYRYVETAFRRRSAPAVA